jgi:hypothetical protein
MSISLSISPGCCRSKTDRAAAAVDVEDDCEVVDIGLGVKCVCEFVARN